MLKLTEKCGDEVSTDRDRWGYAVCFGTVITFVAGIGHVNSFGLIYNDFMIATHSSAKSLTTAHGVFAVMLAFGGIILNMISKTRALRFGGLIGAILFATGSVTTTLISNTNQLPLSFGLLQGIGFGMMVPVCYSTLNIFFVKKRTMIMSICKAVQGIVLVGYPYLLKYLLSFYGFRGTLIILSGISLHTFAGMMIMRTNNRSRSRKVTTAIDLEARKQKSENVGLMRNQNNVEISEDRSAALPKINVNTIRFEIAKFLNLKVLKDLVFCNICVGQSFVNFSDLTFFILQPMLLFQCGYDKMQVATCISICTGADVAGRCALALISYTYSINTRLLFYLATLFTLLFRIVLLQVHQFVWVAALTGVLGILRACLHVASPLVISNHVSHEDFPGAYAFFMLSTGLVNVIFAPLIGMLKDFYLDYVPAFYALTACCVPCLILWPIEYSLVSEF